MAIFRKNNTEAQTEPLPLPQHLGIIMDGNGRWAKKRGLPRSFGHKAGAKTFRKIVKHCEARGIKVVTVYAFSTENWRRPAAEVNAIMDLLRSYLKESLLDFKSENIRTRFIGDRSPLSKDIQELMAEAEASTADRTGMILNIAVNYGGQDEIVHAAKALAAEVKEGKLSPDDIDAAAISSCLYTEDQPPVDLILRPSGEYRLSNFLIWQAAYAEYVFMDVLWPDFSEDDLDRALMEFAGRNRRFGGV